MSLPTSKDTPTWDMGAVLPHFWLLPPPRRCALHSFNYVPSLTDQHYFLRNKGAIRRIKAVEQVLGSQPRRAFRNSRGDRADHCFHREEMVSRPRRCHFVAILWERGHQPGDIRLGVQLSQAGQHCRVCRIADTIGGQQLEGPTRSPFGTRGPGRPSPFGPKAWDETSGASDAAGRVLARLRGPSAAGARFTRATSSSGGSKTDDRQLRRHCCVE